MKRCDKLCRLEILDGLEHLGNERRSRPDQRRANGAGTNANRRIVGPETSSIERIVGKLVAVARVLVRRRRARRFDSSTGATTCGGRCRGGSCLRRGDSGAQQHSKSKKDTPVTSP